MVVFTRMPRKWPSLSSASSASVTLSRALRVGQERFRARRGPLHRPADQLGGQQHQRDLVVDRRLHAEAAADVAGDHAHLHLRHLEHGLGELAAERMRALQRGVDGVAAVGRIVVAERAARLHGGGGDAVDHEVMLDHVGGLGERRIGLGLVAGGVDERDVVLAVVEHQRRAGRGGLGGRHHRRQRLVVDLDQLGGVGRLVPGLRHHERHVVADPAHPVLDQRRVLRPVHRRAVAPLHAAGDRQVAEAGGRPVGAGRAPPARRAPPWPWRCRSAGCAHGRAASAARGRTPCRAARHRRRSARRRAPAAHPRNAARNGRWRSHPWRTPGVWKDAGMCPYPGATATRPGRLRRGGRGRMFAVPKTG